MEIKKLFKYRSVCMAVAMLMLMIYHYEPWWPEGPLYQLGSYMYIAVDVFAFVSGVGCWLSFDRDMDASAFWKRRVLRVMPIYLIVFISWCTRKSPDINLCDISAAFFMAQYLTGRSPGMNWYYSFMLVTYLLTPFLYKFAKRADTRSRAMLYTLGLLFLSFMFWNNDTLIVILVRMVMFFVGMLFAAESRRREKLGKKEVLVLVALMPMGLLMLRWFNARIPEQLWGWGLYWYPALLVVPGLCVLVAMACSWLERFTVGAAINKMLTYIGGFSFELFLGHSVAAKISSMFYIVRTIRNVIILRLLSLPIRDIMLAADRFYQSRKKPAA